MEEVGEKITHGTPQVLDCQSRDKVCRLLNIIGVKPQALATLNSLGTLQAYLPFLEEPLSTSRDTLFENYVGYCN